MQNLWSERDAAQLSTTYAPSVGEALALRTYSSHLLGSELALVRHGGGNTSVKVEGQDLFGNTRSILHIKGSGRDLATLQPRDHVAMDLESLKALRHLPHLATEQMRNQLAQLRLHHDDPMPSIETLLHAWLPATYVDHTHAEAILALTNRQDGEQVVRQALGDALLIVPYMHPGFELAVAALDAFDQHPQAIGMVLMGHGLVTWAEHAQASYNRTLELVTRAEQWIARQASHATPLSVDVAQAQRTYTALAPKLRGLLSPPQSNRAFPRQRTIITPIIHHDMLQALAAEGAEALLTTPPITSDYVLRMKPWPLWLDNLEQAEARIAAFQQRYTAYLHTHGGAQPPTPQHALPHVVFIPGVGALCVAQTLQESAILADLTEQNVRVKQAVKASGGTYNPLSEQACFDMEYFLLQRDKVATPTALPLTGSTAVVTGAAGAIGSGIVRHLLDLGACVAATDLAGAALESLITELKPQYGKRLLGIPMDVTAPTAIQQGWERIITHWGGVDLLVINAGLAHVAPLAQLEMDKFTLLHKVNVEGTLNLLKQAAHHYENMQMGGDIVLISTKNVFAPGASFGAYSATKAASHQLARIASLELAGIGVRVNMVAPDAVFSDGQRASGLWATVGPDRMKARGLDQAGLEAYYRNRNLLKEKITAEDVAHAVAYFATRQSPTTGATLPVDGGLPDATPR
ncbi:short-chain dehydrogenase/reductase SDR [Magnetococcus marinus MC-1]|uniref:Short-chain dehydrogenase/reductase SDR n=1 Tax=Magnetococcus marinus (strain ATCC BAA-1437 / JCM 17883 / MC-1) TaxID=156889 RepID=A0L821_MAGMM|nr:bifunctional aldolase/short-chain dehydrogenase [Magnetococcus marinus]ABK44114.1 short-chain dehydrogenase/reductase SDR [Magnetococcus marinus MC-1]